MRRTGVWEGAHPFSSCWLCKEGTGPALQLQTWAEHTQTWRQLRSDAHRQDVTAPTCAFSSVTLAPVEGTSYTGAAASAAWRGVEERGWEGDERRQQQPSGLQREACTARSEASHKCGTLRQCCSARVAPAALRLLPPRHRPPSGQPAGAWGAAVRPGEGPRHCRIPSWHGWGVAPQEVCAGTVCALLSTQHTSPPAGARC